jgi:hypothetical protein
VLELIELALDILGKLNSFLDINDYDLRGCQICDVELLDKGLETTCMFKS